MPATQDDIDLMSLLSALRSNLWRILGTAFVVGALTYGGLSLVPPTFKSTAQVILEPSARGLLRPQGQEAANVDLKVDESEVSSQAEVMRSRDLLSKVAATEHLDQHPEFNPAPAGQGVLGRVLSMFSGVPSGLEPRERALLILEQSVRVTEVPRTRLISIDATSHDPALAASIANAVAMAYLERNRASQVKTASDTTTYIGSNIAEVKAQAEAAESALERFRAESGLLSGGNNVTLNSQQLSELNTQLTQATAARTEAEARARIVRGMIAVGRVEGSADIVRSANMQALFQQKLRVERDIAELSATMLPAHPRMRQLANELGVTKRRLSEEARNAATGIEDDVQVAKARETALQASIARLTDTKLKSSDAQAKLGSLEREAQSKRSSYEQLLQRLNEVSNQRDRTAVSALASLNESAVPSRVVDSPRKSQLTLLSSAATLLLGMFYVLSRELMRGSSSGGRARPVPATQRKAAGPAFAAPAPLAAAAQDEPPLAATRIKDCAALAVYVASIGRSGEPCRILMTGESEDQDILKRATDLAQRLSSGAARVVLVDLSAATADDGPGLLDLVHGKATFEDVVKQDGTGGWHRILAGSPKKAQRSPSDAAKVELVFSALDAIYQHVIVVAPRAEAKSLLEALDGNLSLGVVCADAGRYARAPVEDGFLGYDVTGLPVAWLEAQPPSGRKRMTRSAQLGQNAPTA